MMIEKLKTNLPNNHGILVSTLLALLSKERSNFTGAIQEHPSRNPVKRFFSAIVKGGVPRAWSFLGVLPFLDTQIGSQG